MDYYEMLFCFWFLFCFVVCVCVCVCVVFVIRLQVIRLFLFFFICFLLEVKCRMLFMSVFAYFERLVCFYVPVACYMCLCECTVVVVCVRALLCLFVVCYATDVFAFYLLCVIYCVCCLLYILFET